MIIEFNVFIIIWFDCLASLNIYQTDLIIYNVDNIFFLCQFVDRYRFRNFIFYYNLILIFMFILSFLLYLYYIYLLLILIFKNHPALVDILILILLIYLSRHVKIISIYLSMHILLIIIHLFFLIMMIPLKYLKFHYQYDSSYSICYLFAFFITQIVLLNSCNMLILHYDSHESAELNSKKIRFFNSPYDFILIICNYSFNVILIYDFLILISYTIITEYIFFNLR